MSRSRGPGRAARRSSCDVKPTTCRFPRRRLGAFRAARVHESRRGGNLRCDNRWSSAGQDAGMGSGPRHRLPIHSACPRCVPSLRSAMPWTGTRPANPERVRLPEGAIEHPGACRGPDRSGLPAVRRHLARASGLALARRIRTTPSASSCRPSRIPMPQRPRPTCDLAGRRHAGPFVCAAASSPTPRPARSPDDPTVHGVLARVLLEPFGDGIRAHEHTMPGPRADRLALLRATRTQLSPILAHLLRPDGAGTAP